MPVPTPRTIRRALVVLEQLPPAALVLLAERLIDRMDALEAFGMDLEPDDDESDDDAELDGPVVSGPAR